MVTRNHHRILQSPLSPYHNLLSLPSANPLRQRRQTRLGKGVWFLSRIKPPLDALGTQGRLIFPLHASATIFCCFHSKYIETILAYSHAFTVEAGVKPPYYELCFCEICIWFFQIIVCLYPFFCKVFPVSLCNLHIFMFFIMGHPILVILYKNLRIIPTICRNYKKYLLFHKMML